MDGEGDTLSTSADGSLLGGVVVAGEGQPWSTPLVSVVVDVPAVLALDAVVWLVRTL